MEVQRAGSSILTADARSDRGIKVVAIFDNNTSH
jgi:hypothetical protein